MPLKIALSRKFAHLDPSLPVVEKGSFLSQGFDVTLMHVSEDELWVWSKYRLLRPMFLTTEEEGRKALEHFRQHGSGTVD